MCKTFHQITPRPRAWSGIRGNAIRRSGEAPLILIYRGEIRRGTERVLVADRSIVPTIIFFPFRAACRQIIITRVRGREGGRGRDSSGSRRLETQRARHLCVPPIHAHIRTTMCAGNNVCVYTRGCIRNCARLYAQRSFR